MAAGVEVITADDPTYPAQLLDDPRRPPALFVRGDLSALDARRVGIVGTRNATQRGRETAARFGYELADEAVVVVSGLAKGIDGAAHRGALAAARRATCRRRRVPGPTGRTRRSTPSCGKPWLPEAH